MRKKLYKNLLILLILFPLCSCGVTTDMIHIDYTPSNHPAISYPTKTILVKKLIDVRGGNPFLIAYKKAAGGKYISDKEISDIVTDAIRNLLSNIGYSTGGSDSELTLTGEILKFETEELAGAFTNKLVGITQVNLKLIDNRNNLIIWNEVISGYAEKNKVVIGVLPQFHKELCDKMLSDLINNIANSSTFKNAVKK